MLKDVKVEAEKWQTLADQLEGRVAIVAQMAEAKENELTTMVIDEAQEVRDAVKSLTAYKGFASHRSSLTP